MDNGLVLPPRYGLSLCAGGGGLDMGLGLAEPGFATSCYCEIEEYPRSTIIAGQRSGYLHPAPIWDDLKTFNARPWRGQIDTLLAGYPCQPFSQAGQRKGEDDPRHLWPDIERIIEELGDGLAWCFFENVAGHLTLGLETVVRSLQGMDFRVAVGLFSAEETGTSHERQRVFIVAYRRYSERWPVAPAGHITNGQDTGRTQGHSGTGERSTALADSQGAHRRRELPPREKRRWWSGSSGGSRKLAYADGGDACSERQRSGGQQRLFPQGGAHGIGHHRSLHPPGPNDMHIWRDVLKVNPDGAPAISLGDLSAFSRYFAALVEAGDLSEAEAERRLCRMADGLASRSRGLRLLGNGVHPLAAAYAWRSLSAAHGLGSVDLGAEDREQKTPAARAALT